jgi:large subunit ribosomal protein L6
MSRVGKLPIPIPSGVEIKIDGQRVTVKGPKGSLEREVHPKITAVVEDGSLVVKRHDEERDSRALHGLSRALLNNMVVGVTEGFTKVLEIVGVGYRAEMSGNNLVMHLGFSHPVEIEPMGEIQFTVEDRGRTIFITGINKEFVGRTAADIRKLRPPEPYKGKGVRYRGERVRRKAGKTGI